MFELDRRSAAAREALTTRNEADLSACLGPVGEIVETVPELRNPGEGERS